ncbi:hypothetical protein OAL32_04000 [Synechococcus sp. AH-551-G15]|nr:hypothetical protein [Synechococcus sp. AH-551-G15]
MVQQDHPWHDHWRIRRILSGQVDMLKILIGVGLGFLLFTNPEARQITGDLLRSAGDAIAPESSEQKTLQERINQVLESK